MSRAAIEEAVKIDKLIKNFSVTPFPEVSKRLADATRATVEVLSQHESPNSKDGTQKYE